MSKQEQEQPFLTSCYWTRGGECNPLFWTTSKGTPTLPSGGESLLLLNKSFVWIQIWGNDLTHRDISTCFRWAQSLPPSCTTSCATAAVWAAWTGDPSSSSSPWKPGSKSQTLIFYLLFIYFLLNAMYKMSRVEFKCKDIFKKRIFSLSAVLNYSWTWELICYLSQSTNTLNQSLIHETIEIIQQIKMTVKLYLVAPASFTINYIHTTSYCNS